MKPFIYIIMLITACVPVQPISNTTKSTATVLSFEDKIIDPAIKTVQLYPNKGELLDQVNPPVVNLSNNNLVLEFDELAEDATNFRVKIYNCTHNWMQSKLSAIEYITDYNEFDITSYEYSIDTDHPYVHYRFELPKVKLPGNYVIQVYRSSNENDIVLSKRFMVFDNRIEIVQAEEMNSIGNLTRKNQRIEFFIRYQNYAIERPRESVIVKIRQNNRWDNALEGIKPAYVREDINELEYRFFNTSELMKGGNEFRLFDFRSVNYPGYRVHSMNRENGEYHMKVVQDKIRGDLAYSQYVDKNGKFYIQNYDFGNFATSSNYVRVNFSLAKDRLPPNAEIYLFGGLTNYELTPNHQLSYNQQNGAYELELLLKQGDYDYQYYCKNDSLNYNYIEGDYFETENDYEILVYHRPFGGRTDLLIGYKSL